MADELLELSSKTGIATDELQKMQYASDFLDVSTETMTSSMTKLIRSMDDARKGSKELDDSFAKLHVRYKDGNGELLDSNEVFYKTIDALGKVRNETERDALAMTVFGKSARELNPLIEAGSKRLKELGIEAEDMGVIMSESSLNELSSFKDSMDKLNNTFEATKLKLGLVLMPILQGFADLLSSIPAPVLTGIIVFGALAAIFMSLAKTISTVSAAQTMLAAANVTVGATGTIATAGMSPLLLILLAIAAVIAIIVGGAVALKGALKDAETAGNDAINNATKVADTLQNSQSNTRRAVGYANGTKDAIGGTAWVGEAGPELVRLPRGSQVYTNAESKAMTGDTYISVTVPVNDLKQINDVVSWANGLKQQYRQGRVRIG
jgi:phage-related minor tail protein